ncbi:MAG: hypothetical protein JWP34_2525 [Massilia sp.]|jgi:hypothetical protein|nr:hypothetical protein [Massilia sp.]
MPIEIRELHIRVAVSAPAGAESAGTPAAPAAAGAGGAGGGQQAQDKLVAECVEQVLRILHNKLER